MLEFNYDVVEVGDVLLVYVCGLILCMMLVFFVGGLGDYNFIYIDSDFVKKFVMLDVF